MKGDGTESPGAIKSVRHVDEMVRWQSGATALECRVCDFKGDGEHVADFNVPGRTDAQAVRCPDCGSVELLEDNMDGSPDDAAVDGYVEAVAGIEAIAGGIAQVEPSTVRRFLDVGCNYGFALDIGRFLHDWDVVGVEPSYAGRRGADELGLDIRNIYLADDVEVGEAFDLILASEVVEHVQDPLAFLQMLGRRLTPKGVVILTTPAAEIVRPEESLGEVLSAVSPGLHVFLASKDGLEQLLHRAGFKSIQVTRTRGALKAAASFDPDATFRGSDPVDDIVLEPYYASRADIAPEGSSLASGMAIRHLRLLVSRGLWDESEASAARAIAAMRARHGLDLEFPDRVRAAVTDTGVVPWNLYGLAFALGMKAMLHDHRPELAADYFELVIASTDIWEQTKILDLDEADLRLQARVQLANALVDIKPEVAARLAGELGNHFDATNPDTAVVLAYRKCRIFVDLVVRGHLDAGRELQTSAAEHAPRLVKSPEVDHVAAGLDGMFALGMLELQTNEPEAAIRWFSRCINSAASTGGVHAIAEAATEHIKIAQAQLSQRPAAPSQPKLTVSHNLDVYWCDASGTFLEGWVLVHEAPVSRIEIRIAEKSVDASSLVRADLEPFFEHVAHAATGGFTAYIPGAPRGRATLILHTTQGVTELELTLPDHPLPELETYPYGDVLDQTFGPYFAELPPGPVLFVGQRQRSELEWLALTAFFGDREVIGLDIHEGWGVDVVGDAHSMSSQFSPGQFAAVLSASLLEHVAAPWLVALETARVLQVGGYSFQAAPWMWPTHAMPSDFWRISAVGLQLMFGPNLGFETVSSGEYGGVVTVPSPDWRGLQAKMPTTSSHAMSWIVSRKVAEPDPTISWPYDAAEGADLARMYPVDALPLQKPTK